MPEISSFYSGGTITTASFLPDCLAIMTPWTSRNILVTPVPASRDHQYFAAIDRLLEKTITEVKISSRPSLPQL
jgi:hypothetical protein